MAELTELACSHCGSVWARPADPEPGVAVTCPECGEETAVSQTTQLVSTASVAEIAGSEDDREVSLPHETNGTDLPSEEDAGPEGSGDVASAGPGKYVHQGAVGKGGMGEVLVCIDRDTRRQIAMKRMLPAAASDTRRRARFVEEAQVTAQLEHPNIVPVYELAKDAEGNVYYTMKLLKGRSLADILDAVRDGKERSDLSELLHMFLHVCDGIGFAHSRGVLHRDLKPDNIMAGDFGEVLVMDWGLAKIVGREDIRADDLVTSSRGEHGERLTKDGTTMGTPCYMPPEQAEGKLEVIDHRSDIYSLGAILYEVLTLEPPFSGKTMRAVLAQVINASIVPPRKRAPGRHIPRELSAIAMKCMAGAPEERYQSVGELRRDISLFLEGRSVSAAPDRFLRALVKLGKRNKGVSAAIAVAATVIICVVSLAFVRVTGAMERAVQGEQEALAAKEKQRATALTASEALAKQAVRAAEQGRLAEADVRADASVKVMPGGPWGHYALAMVASERRDLDAQQRHLGEALRLDSSHQPSKAAYSDLMATAGKLKDAAKLLDHVKNITDWRALLAAGKVLSFAGQYDDAAEIYQRAVAVMGEDGTVQPRALNEAKERLEGANVAVECRGFHESIRNRPADEQQRRLTEKLSAVHRTAMVPAFVVEEGLITEISFEGQKALKWLQPLKGLSLASLDLSGTSVNDLSPLRGMPLRRLVIRHTRVSDLSPLRGMLLTHFDCAHTEVRDLGPLEEVPLTYLDCGTTQVSDLGPLRAMPLGTLQCWATKVSDLGPLKGMKLVYLNCADTPVSDLEPLRGMGLKDLAIYLTDVSDLTPLSGMQLELFLFTPKRITGGIEVIRATKSIRKIGDKWERQMGPDEFWRSHGAEEPK